MPQVSAGRCPSTSVVVAAHFAQPSIDALLARGDAGIADARVFGECAFLVVANGPDMYAVAVALEKQAVACSNAQEPADFDGTVICPLLVILDCFCMAICDSLLYHRIPYPGVRRWYPPPPPPTIFAKVFRNKDLHVKYSRIRSYGRCPLPRRWGRLAALIFLFFLLLES